MVKSQLTHDTERVGNRGHIEIAAGQVDDEDRFHILKVTLCAYGDQNENISARADDWGED